jgi:hypothetical protein
VTTWKHLTHLSNGQNKLKEKKLNKQLRSLTKTTFMAAGRRALLQAAVVGAALSLLFPVSARTQQLSEYTVDADGHFVHVMPTVGKSAGRIGNPPSAGPLNYHGGPVMQTATTYAIFWLPPTLQTGGATSLPAHYQSVATALLSLYPGHGIDNNNTQYSAKAGFFASWYYIENACGFAGSYVDNSPYPASGCSDSYTPGNCLSDAQIQAEISKVMALKGWTGGFNKMFFLFTSSGEGSCAGFGCAYTSYCAYHGYFGSASNPIIYGNEPYADPAVCQVAGTPSPNGDAAGDAAATIASHELTEAITDPELNAWYASDGEEIGDLCAWNYGPNTWDSGNANQSWFTAWSFFSRQIGYFELQQEYDNNAGGCVQVGP